MLISGLLDRLKDAAGFGGKRSAAADGGESDADAMLRAIEAHAVDIARHAGGILRGHFERALKVEYKDDKQSDPVTNADYESQRYLQNAIVARFPDHGVLGEEDDAARRDAADKQPAPNFVWVLDPLDGTRNFLSGLPLYACSIGVLHKGVPVVAAVFLPWPANGGGIVLHARKGGGAYADDAPISVWAGAEPAGNRLVTLPGGFGAMFSARPELRPKLGELRMSGSIAYELAMVAKGVTQYTLTTAPFLWDAAGGALLVMEAGGVALQGIRRKRFGLPTGAVSWQPLESFAPDWIGGKTTMRELREWRAPLLLGSPGVARYVAANLRGRSMIAARVRRRIRRRRRGA